MPHLGRGFLAMSATILALLAAPQAKAQSIFGLVSDLVSGAPLPAATVSILSSELSVLEQIETGSLGTFQLTLPGPGSYLVSVSAAGYIARLSDEIDVEGGELVEVMFTLAPVEDRIMSASVRPLESPTKPGTADLFGHVKRHDAPAIIEGVEVSIDEIGLATITNSNGYFSLKAVPQGLYEVTFSHIAFGEQSTLLLVEAGNGYELDVTLSEQPIPIEGVTVTLRSRAMARSLAQVEFRMGHNKHLGGIYLTRSDLELRGEQPLSSILRSIVGVGIRKFGHEYMVGLGRGCRGNPGFFVDGVRVANRLELLPLDMIPTMNIEVIEIYKGPASLPAEFGGADSQCGAIVIWTRRGG